MVQVSAGMSLMQSRNGTSKQQPRKAITVLELLVTMFIVGFLLSVLLPAVQSARESARRVHCQNNLRQLGIALHLHHDTYQSLPAGWYELTGKPVATGWIPDLLPYLEQAELRSQVQTDWPEILSEGSSAGSGLSMVPSSTPGRLMKTPSVLLCPSDVADGTFRLYMEEDSTIDGDRDQLSEEVLMELPQANYVGIAGYLDPDEPSGYDGAGTFVHRRKFSFRDLTRGLSEVAVISERTARKLPSTWLGFHLLGEDAPGRVLGFCNLGPNIAASDECELDSRHPGCVLVLFADGHVQTVSDGIDQSIYRKMAIRAD
jgi:prepilin-type processing-associated H-X9-DG protein